MDPISLKVRLNMLKNGLVITMNYILQHADQMNISFHGESVRIKHFIFIRLKGVQELPCTLTKDSLIYISKQALIV